MVRFTNNYCSIFSNVTCQVSILLCISIFLDIRCTSSTTNSYQKDNTQTNFNCKTIENTRWVNNTVDCDAFQLHTNGKATYYFCDRFDTISCSYKLISKDTLIIEELKGKWEGEYETDSVPTEAHGQNVFHINGDTLIPLYYKWYFAKLHNWRIEKAAKNKKIFWYLKK